MLFLKTGREWKAPNNINPKPVFNFVIFQDNEGTLHITGTDSLIYYFYKENDFGFN